MVGSRILDSLSPVTMVALGLFLLLMVGMLNLLWDRKKNVFNLPGPMPLPFLGNALKFLGPPEAIVETIAKITKTYGPGPVRVHLGSRPNVLIYEPEGFQKILSSSKQITKGTDYKMMWPWLGTGLGMSTGEKWHARRRMITPAFHFKILESFIDVMNDQCLILCDNVLAPLANGKEVDVCPIVAHATLDILCETAMGRSINAQQCSDTGYQRAINDATELVVERQRSPWIWDNWAFGLSLTGYRMRKVLKIIHGFSEKVISERKVELVTELGAEEGGGQKRRRAFLDHLLEMSQGSNGLSDMDIREEVDTLMSGGFNSTATNISFTLWLLATHPEVQARCHRELDSIFGDSSREPTNQDLAAMKYLDCCLKESLRLYPSAPMISRTLSEEVEIGGKTIPAQTDVFLLIFVLHRDPTCFPDPDRFDPDRFSLDNQQKLRDYSYVPFSAGLRNCIGQKFVKMEQKLLISSVLRSYTLKSSMTVEEIPLVFTLFLQPKHGLRVAFTRR